ncbi:uncharacterized protein LOC126351614 [Schistocerca gregaria]|uniref:uncharacterized protein LOC126351614 n=1 Tax=Schistocerca gregaria TaxID=7010 RepID=UPI00211E76FF|nr:uncharacterized protein LOC126351614 [Schistocerca gregaria]
MKTLAIILAIIPLAMAGKKHKYEHLIHDKYGALFYHDYAALSTLFALKIKAAFLIAAFIIGIAWFYKAYGFGYKCHYGYNHHDRLGVHRAPYQTGREMDTSFIQDIANRIDITDLAFNIMNIDNTACRKKFVCSVTELTDKQPLLQNVISYFRGNLEQYGNTSHVTNSTRDCNAMFPSCSQNFFQLQQTAGTDTIIMLPSNT